jgi:hypothetical protein
VLEKLLELLTFFCAAENNRVLFANAGLCSNLEVAAKMNKKNNFVQERVSQLITSM